MKVLPLFALAFALQAEDKPKPYPPSNPGGVVAHESDIKALKEHVAALEQRAVPPKSPDPTIEQLQAQIAQRDQQIAYLQRKVAIYQQAAFGCQDSQIDAQAKQQAQPQRSAKPEAK